MILRLLSLFPAVARLIDDLGEAETARLLSQDRLATAENDRARVWNEMLRAQEAERHALHMLVNIEYQRHYGIAPFPDGVKLPPPAHSGGSPNMKMTPGQAVEAQTAKIVREMQSRWSTSHPFQE